MTVVKRPLTMTVAALGGQGGGVVADWMIAVARSSQYLVQATSVPGVAQRTGATIYYLEFFPEDALPGDGRRPVMALMPSPGDVDVVVASELVEAGRAIQRGLVTPDRTTLIASTHRAYTISEKSNLADGRADPAVLLEQSRAAAQRFVAFDMDALAEQHGAVISSVILGAIAGGASLPFPVDAYRAAIREGGIAVETNLAAFESSYGRAKAGGDARQPQTSAAALPQIPAALAGRIRGEFPEQSQATLVHGVARLIDYQDLGYAEEYLARVAGFAKFDNGTGALTEAVARGLALWMSFEDTLRVAQLKTRARRTAGIHEKLRVRPGQVVELREFMKPRVEEICGTLPAALGRRLLTSPGWRRRIERHTGGRQIRTSTITGFASLRALAGMRRWRRGTLRYAEEQARIADWLERIASLARTDYGLAVEVARCQTLVRGYGDTHERGFANHTLLLDAAQRLCGREDAVPAIARLRRAAAADERGEALGRELRTLGLA
jgi:indolepyruvate ferredoxin oxidoreductase beta subunit